MDQLKDILKQVVKYRFWIVVGVAAILPMVAYFVGSGPVKLEADTQKKVILDASSGVKPYSSGVVPNAQYKPIVAEKTVELTQDIDLTWKHLYARQAPLLTWPKTVEDRFHNWGRKWPENVDASAVQLAIIDYVTAYPKFVTEVYETFQPFDPTEGTGIVAAPPEESLLKPAKFTIENPPELGKVWAAQERLWIQRTLLDVVAQVNKDAKDWDSAIIKQINVLEAGNPAAQDQKSLAKGETVEEAPAIAAPGAAEAATTETSTSSSPMGDMASMMGGAGAAASNVESVYYVKTESTQFKILPVEMSVLIEQNHIQDFLVELENSPMAIQVAEFELAKPSTRVVKPRKGESVSFAGAMGGGGMMSGYSAMMRMGAMGGAAGRGPAMTGYGGGMADIMRKQMGSMMDMGGATGSAAAKGGVDKRSENRAAKRKEQDKTTKSVAPPSLHDPYYNVVEVTIYGQARFYNPPPVEAAAEPSKSEEATKAEAPAGPTDADAKEKAEAPKAEAPKGETEPGQPEASKDEVEKTKPGTEKAKGSAKGDAEPANPKIEPPDGAAEPKGKGPKSKTEPSEPDATNKK